VRKSCVGGWCQGRIWPISLVDAMVHQSDGFENM
jgi:hypothetical protein